MPPEILVNPVRRYAWGSTRALAGFLGAEPTGEPQAELWMGAHPGSPSLVDRGAGPQPLDRLIAADPLPELGPSVLARFGPQLPFLAKVLAVGRALSVQVHPSTEQAEAGFAEEEARGVPLDAPDRNYRDRNHKPEMVCALDDFDALCGFRPCTETAELLDALGVPALDRWVRTLRTAPEPEALRTVLAEALADGHGGGTTRAVAAALPGAASAAAAAGSPHHAALAACAAVASDYPGDPGIIAALLLNHVRLRPGQALYLGAGVPHAYLGGLGVEVMANSDNVLRCGLTPKHVDVPELLRVVGFRSTAPDLIDPRPVPGAVGEEAYPAPVDEFTLTRHTLTDADPDGVTSQGVGDRGPQILLCVSGEADLLAADGGRLRLTRGQSAYLPAAAARSRVVSDGAVLFRVGVRPVSPG
ncbi:mannose-6-phosphate isomerase, class I [Streptacidiphilus cavernicola]|uniref:mannose-6-phosphate isomerase n=1 Tax=Streptacidiphilus cavernicola TaxID=3342716 RepID=A0ABV6VR43_9ACTN